MFDDILADHTVLRSGTWAFKLYEDSFCEGKEVGAWKYDTAAPHAFITCPGANLLSPLKRKVVLVDAMRI
jgi:hypothetical protein